MLECARRNIFKAKNRPFFDPLIVHTHTIDNISTWVNEVPEKAKRLANIFWPGPLTLVLKKKIILEPQPIDNEHIELKISNKVNI